MATRTVTTTELIDDLDGTNADRTVRFAVDGVNYEIDLSKKNAAGFEKALKPYIGAARKARRSSTRSRGRGRGNGTPRRRSRASGRSRIGARQRLRRL
jgi:hypothetical protein